MNAAKIAISLDTRLLHRLDSLVERHLFRNRSEAVREAIQEKLERLGSTRLAAECARLDPQEEQQFADIGLAEDLSEWPEY